MKHLLILALCGALAVVPTAASSPYVIGEQARDLSRGDLADIIAATAPHGSVWLMDVYDIMFLKPPNLQVIAYLSPETTTLRLRRGQRR